MNRLVHRQHIFDGIVSVTLTQFQGHYGHIESKGGGEGRFGSTKPDIIHPPPPSPFQYSDLSCLSEYVLSLNLLAIMNSCK